MTTCGDVNGGKPCEFSVYDGGCPMWAHIRSDTDACVPVVALLEARAESARWKRAADEDRDELAGLIAKWKRVAEFLSKAMYPNDRINRERVLEQALKDIP